MGKVLMQLIAIMFLVAFANAETLVLEWTFDSDVTDGTFYISERTSTGKIVLVEDIPVTDTSASILNQELPEGGGCRTYFITYKTLGLVDSTPSNAVGWCPEYTLPDLIVRPGDVINLKIRVVEE